MPNHAYTYCVSDLHLGDRGPRDNFAVGDREQSFGRFLDFVAETDGRLFILGDLFDWWQCNLSKSIIAYQPLLNRLNKMDVTWIVGNHDAALREFISIHYLHYLSGFSFFDQMRLPFVEDIGGRRFAFLHGHEADPYCRDDNPGIGEMTAIISGILEDRHAGPQTLDGRVIEDQLVDRLERLVSVWHRLQGGPARLHAMVMQVEEYRRQQKADAVVYGHTHEAGSIGDHHFNTGTWARERNTFVRIHHANGLTELIEWVGDECRLFARDLAEVNK